MAKWVSCQKTNFVKRNLRKGYSKWEFMKQYVVVLYFIILLEYLISGHCLI